MTKVHYVVKSRGSFLGDSQPFDTLEEAQKFSDKVVKLLGSAQYKPQIFKITETREEVT